MWGGTVFQWGAVLRRWVSLVLCYVLAGTQDERDVRSDSVWVQGFSVSMVRGYDEALTAK